MQWTSLAHLDDVHVCGTLATLHRHSKSHQALPCVTLAGAIGGIVVAEYSIEGETVFPAQGNIPEVVPTETGINVFGQQAAPSACQLIFALIAKA